jgi:glycosyltransferase involved in cell wall biosynthesis
MTEEGRALVSILTPVFNGWEFLPDCAQGVYAQEGVAREWLIGINGHGADGGAAAAATAALLAARPPPPDCLVRPLVLPHARGKVEAINALVAAATAAAPWIAVLDCDDVWAPRKLAAQLSAASPAGPAAGADVIGTHCLYFGDMLAPGPRLPSGWIPSDAWRSGNPLINSSVILRRELAHWEDRFGLDDYDLWIRLSLAGRRMYNLAEPLTYHRIHATSAFNGKGRQDVRGLLKAYGAAA